MKCFSEIRLRAFKSCWCITFFLLLFCSFLDLNAGPFERTKNLPVASQGRFRSLEPAARIWLYDFYHLQQLKREQLPIFQANDNSALELLWKAHLLGPSFMDNAPLFWIHYADVKKILGLDLAQSRFSYNELNHAIYENRESNLRLMRTLLPFEFAKKYHSPDNRSRSNKQELKTLTPGLWLSWREGGLIVSASPVKPPWNFLSVNMPMTSQNVELEQIEKQNKLFSEELLQLFQHLQTYRDLFPPPSDIQNGVDLDIILRQAGTTLKMLPSKQHPGEWLSLHALNIQVAKDSNNNLPTDIANFTSFNEEDFLRLRLSYNKLKAQADKYYNPASEENFAALKLSLEQSVNQFSLDYEKAYVSIADKPYLETINKQLSYPSHWQLQMETWYYHWPLIELSLFAYSLALILFLIGYTAKRESIFRYAFVAVILGFSIHTLILVLRCLVLQRPPVSNMFETVVYVPWVAMVLGFVLFTIFRRYIILIAATAASACLLILLKLTDVDARMENVQAVLDSQYWLIVHVLMIVGSYGVFIVCGVLAHFYLVACALNRQSTPSAQFTAKCILHTMYIGVALLIPGTILGGVWAAESWGRFWDWDPKESWAFISACIYVLIIHAYTFKKIHDYGLAIGAIAGLMAISFTWYGVNYILGTGLHSYGFGQGGEMYYYGYLLIESLFLAGVHGFVVFRKAEKRG